MRDLDLESSNPYTEGNPYGYRLNVNHPKVRELYERYKTKVLHEHIAHPVSDAQRVEFENIILRKIEHNRKKDTA